ncbi:MAG: hypothetical protein JNN13_14000 [Planctomycetes bacterium]|nr:hypothetical protein [Planctomycetota bacterium]
MRVLAILLGTTFFVGCSDPAAATQLPSPPPRPAPLQLEHDFGVLAHGERRETEFLVDLAALGEPLVPLRVHLDCQCGQGELRLRDRDGNDRFVDGRPIPANLPTADERLYLRVTVDTNRLEATDLPPVWHRGFLVLQSPADMTGTMRVSWPVRIRFAMDAPVELRPFTALDFGSVPVSSTKTFETTLRGDEHHRDLTFAAPVSDDPLLRVELGDGDPRRLRAFCTPGAEGNHRALVTIPTSLPGYTLRLQATWKSVPDLEASPLAKIAFRTDLAQAQPANAADRQFVLVTDHDTRRPAEFAVFTVVAGDGRDLAPCFDVTLTPVPGNDRQHRLAVRYRGGLDDGVRATIRLTKAGADGPFLPIELVVFPTKDS